jgi:hypothetical protein
MLPVGFCLCIYVAQTLRNCILFHATPAAHLGHDNINKELKTKKGYNLIVCLSPLIAVARSSSVFLFSAGGKYFEFLCCKFKRFNRLNV